MTDDKPWDYRNEGDAVRVVGGVIAAATNVVKRFPNEPETPFAPRLTDHTWAGHIRGPHPEITIPLLHQITENGDQVTEHRVYRQGKLSEEGVTTHTWVAVIDGEVYMARATIGHNTAGLEIGTAYRVDKSLKSYDQWVKNNDHKRVDN
jgi:hypothetical protein